jgi:hypothetical protein
MTTASTTTAGRRITNTSDEVADRLAIRELINAHALFADRREPDEQAVLYAEDGRTLVYNELAASNPAQVLTGHAEHVEGFRVLSDARHRGYWSEPHRAALPSELGGGALGRSVAPVRGDVRSSSALGGGSHASTHH